MAVVGQHFRPEFINRIDESVVFHPLGSAQIRAIAAIQTQRVVKRLAERGIVLRFSDAALDHLAEAGYDPIYGARPLKRVIQRALQDPLAEALLAGDIRDGETIEVSAGADGLIIGDRVGSSSHTPPEDAVVH